MNQFGSVAVVAANYLGKSTQLAPEMAWDQAMHNSSLSSTTIDKGCPKEAFVGLVNCGLVLGVNAQTNLAIGWNGVYAIAAAWILKNSNAAKLRQKGDAMQLWQQVLNCFNLNSHKTHNSQMDVVLELWVNNLI